MGNGQIVNYSPIQVRSGGSLPNLTVTADYTVNNFSSVKTLSGTYRAGFKLIDAGGNAVTPEAFSSSFSVSLPPRGAAQGTATAVIPSSALAERTHYQLLAQLYVAGAVAGTWTAAGFPNTSNDDYQFVFADPGQSIPAVGLLSPPSLTRAYLVATAPAQNSFEIQAGSVLGRFEQAGQPAASSPYQVFYTLVVTGTRSGDIALINPRFSFTVNVANHSPDGSAAGSAVINQALDFQPQKQIDPTDSYAIKVSLSHAGPDGVEVADQDTTLSSQRLLQFNGTLLFGAVATTLTALRSDPTPEGTVDQTGENTEVQIDDQGAHLNANPAAMLNSGQTIHVLLGLDGTATTQDAATLADMNSAFGTVAGVSYTLSGASIDNNGIHASGGTVQFPAGFGVSSAPNVRRLNASHPIGALDLNANLQPAGVIALLPGQLDSKLFYAVHEDLPEQFLADLISWDTAAGTFTLHRTGTRHVRADEIATLNGLPTVLETLIAKLRPSNDGYLAAPGPDGGDVVIQADAQGRAILQQATVTLPANQFTSHFPSDITVAWGQTGELTFKAGAVDPANSSLPGAADVALFTLPGAPTLTLIGGEETFQLHPDSGAWNFTPDGALYAQGTFPTSPLKWGARSATDFAQTAASFGAASALVPGFLLRGASATTAIDSHPGELLLTGQGKPGDPTYVEHPLTPPYAAGLADYAGLNVRTLGDGSQNGTSLLGDATFGPYPLSATSKYYLRKAGVSGIQAADHSYFSGKGIGLTMDGFALMLTDYQLAYLDNKATDSRVAGTINVPGVRGTNGFSQDFTKLIFDTQGQPGELTLAQNPALEHPLYYWHARFHPLGAEFLPKPSDPKQAALVFGAEVLLPGLVKEPIRGGLGFLPSGRLASAADGFPGVNSRLKAPKQITLHGPGSLNNDKIAGFVVNPVGDLYFNDPYYADPKAPGTLLAPDDGFVAFAGIIKLPFFANLQVHVLARADSGRSAIRAGWKLNKQTFFTDSKFDSANIGFPPNDSYANYINENEPAGFTYFVDGDASHPRNLYNPLVQQSWLGGVNFALPVKWDPARRRFLSTVPEQRDFLIMTSQRVLQQLTPSGADIRFGLQFNNLPRLNLTSLIIDDQEAEKALQQFIPGVTQLSAAIGAFDKLLGNDSDQLIAAGFDTVLNTFLDYLFGDNGPLKGLSAATDAAKAIGAPADQAFKDLSAKLKDQLSGATTALNLANSLFGEVADGLDIIDKGLSTADVLLQKDKNGKRGTFITDAVNYAITAGVQADDVQSVTSSITDTINGELAPTLDQLSDSLDDVHSLSDSARKLVTTGRDVTAKALGAINVAETLPNDILSAMHDYFAQLHDPVNPGTALQELGVDQLRAQLKKVALNAIMESDFVAQLQETVRDLVDPLHEEYGVVFDQILGAFNDIVRSALEELNNQVVDHLNEDVGNVNRAVGNFQKALQISKVDGSAQIVGNVLDHAHLNATLGIAFPDKVTLAGAIDFKRVHADQPVPPCVTGAADGSIQITVTARGDASLGGNKAAHAELHGQYTMTAQGDPLALSGGMSLDADVHVDIVTLKKADFEFVIGEGDNYVRAEGAGSILLFDVNTRAFFGRTCDPELVKWIDPHIDALFDKLGRPKVSAASPLIGYYGMADGDVVLNRLLDIPDAVVLLKAGGGQGCFIFCDPAVKSIIPGMHYRLSIGVGLGSLSAQAELVALGGLDPISLAPSTTDFINVAENFLKDPVNTVKGAVAGRFSPKFTAGLISWTQDYDFTASGSYLPVPPPGFFLARRIDF